MFWRILSPDFITGYSACVQLLRITKHVAKLRNSNISNDQKYKIVKGQIAVRITRQSNHFIISFILWPITWDYTLFVMYIISIMIYAYFIVCHFFNIFWIMSSLQRYSSSASEPADHCKIHFSPVSNA